MQIDWFTLATIAFAVACTAPLHRRTALAGGQFAVGLVLLLIALTL